MRKAEKYHIVPFSFTLSWKMLLTSSHLPLFKKPAKLKVSKNIQQANPVFLDCHACKSFKYTVYQISAFSSILLISNHIVILFLMCCNYYLSF